jgi:hypothetical protein
MRCSIFKGVALAVLVAALLAPSSDAAGRVTPAQRAAINALLDKFIPDVVRGDDPAAGRTLVAHYISVGSVQHYPAKGTTFHGWLTTYASARDIGFDILLQPTVRSLGAWSFRAEAQQLAGRWKITTWYPVATFAPPERTQTVIGPNDSGAQLAGSAHGSGATHGRLGAWVLVIPIAALGSLALAVLAFVLVRAARTRARIRRIERSLSS